MNLGVLHQHAAELGDPTVEDFDYQRDFQSLDLDARTALGPLHRVY